MHEPLRLVTQKLPMVERRNMLTNIIDPAYALKRSNFENNGPQEIRAMLQHDFNETYGRLARQAWPEVTDPEISADIYEKLNDLFDFPESLSFCNFEVTCRAKVTQQEEGLQDAALTLNNNWPTVRMTLNKVNEIGFQSLDAPANGLGFRYNVNLNHRITWVTGKGPTCDEEMLPAKATKEIAHAGTNTNNNPSITPTEY